MKNISIIGAGNIGTAMLAMLSQRKDLNVTVYSSKKNLWKGSIKYRGIDNESEWHTATNFRVTDDLAETVKNAEQIFVTLPSFLREKLINDIHEYIAANTLVAFIPGCGGVEFFCHKLIEKKCRIIGFDRVPSVSRIKEYGKSVEFEWKKSLRAAGLNVCGDEMKEICCTLSEELGLEFTPLENYLSITLTPANPLMHPVRLYSMFKDMKKEDIIDHNILFYGEWDDATSECLFKCDDELQELSKALGVKDVISLRKHYESYTPEQMTTKMHSIPSFKKVQSPLKYDENGHLKIDFNSRYFVEDFPFGICILKGLADICGTKSEMISTIINWYLKIINEPENNIDILSKNGIKTKGDIRKFYNMK